MYPQPGRFPASILLALGTLLAMGACGGSEGAQSVRPETPFTPAQRASLDRIFSDVKHASQLGFETGDWSTMASIYPEGALACWDASGEDHRFSFLSMEPIAQSAKYRVASLEGYMHGGDVSRMRGTHFMSIRYETSFGGGCGLPAPKRWPEHHIYLREEGEKFVPVHPCPSREQIEGRMILRTWPMVSGAQAAQVFESMSIDERQSIREQVRRDRFPLVAIHSIQQRHGLSDKQASLVLDRVCGDRL